MMSLSLEVDGTGSMCWKATVATGIHFAWSLPMPCHRQNPCIMVSSYALFS